jgi:hypothetical protein
MNKRIRDIRRTFMSEGVDVLQMDHLGNGHIRFTTGVGLFVVGSTPSDSRWMHKFRSEIRRKMR